MIFCQSKNNRDSVLDMMAAFDRLTSESDYSGLTVRQYHADISPEEKDGTLSDWLNDSSQEIDIIVTTKGFALGLDKRNIRTVCSYRLPPDGLELIQAVHEGLFLFVDMF